MRSNISARDDSFSTLIKRSVIVKCHERRQKKAAQVHAAFIIGGAVLVAEGVVFLLYLCENTIQKPKTLKKQLCSIPHFCYEAGS